MNKLRFVVLILLELVGNGFIFGQSTYSLKGPYRQKAFYEQLYGESYPPAQVWLDMWNRVQALPTDRTYLRSENGWQYEGPAPAIKHPARPAKTVNSTGRIRDIALNVPKTEVNDKGLRILAATGGVWALTEKIEAGKTSLNAILLSRNLPVKDFTSFAFHPSQKGVFFVGSGEPFLVCGTGLWHTRDNGLTWQQVIMSPEAPYPCLIHKLFYDRINPLVLHAATSSGYMRSNDGGQTWGQKTVNVDMTDVVQDPLKPDRLLGMAGNGRLYQSQNNGQSWEQISHNLPLDQSVHGVLAIDPKTPQIIFANLVATNNLTLGLYKSKDGGKSFEVCTFQGGKMVDIHWAQGYFNNVIAVSPNKNSIVLAGGGMFIRSTNALDFEGIDSHHADQHAIVWDQNGDMYLANDGGLFVSSNDGLTFSAKYNIFPITQFYQGEIHRKDPTFIVGGTQDNGTVYRNRQGWFTFQNGDGISGAVNQENPEWFYATSNAAWKMRSTNKGDNWFGILVCPYDAVVGHERSNSVRQNSTNTPIFYCLDRVYRYDQDTAVALTPNALPGNVYFMSISNRPTTSDRPNIYTTIIHSDPALRLSVRRRNSNNWVTSGNTVGLPEDTYVRVFPHPTKFDVAYAVCLGIPASGSNGAKLFKTTDAGLTWDNISGDMPNLPLSCMLAHPKDDNQLVVGTGGFGFLASTDGGTTWKTYNSGAAIGTLVSDLDYTENSRGQIFLIAATYGHGFLKREWKAEASVSTADQSYHPTDLKIFTIQEGANYQLHLNNHSSHPVDIVLVDLRGQRLKTLHSGLLIPGNYDFEVDLGNFPRGVYVIHLKLGNSVLRAEKVLRY